jgi:hypothetical protein
MPVDEMSLVQEELRRRNKKRIRGGLGFKAHTSVSHNSRAESNQEEKERMPDATGVGDL